MTDVAAWTRPEAPYIHQWPAPAGEVADALVAWEHAAPGKRVARTIRGKKCMTKEALFDEFAAALQFPPYFGGNWDGFADCFRDLHRFGEKSAVVIAIVDVEKIPAELMESLVEVLAVCLPDVNQPEKPLKPRPLHLVIAGKTVGVARKLRAAGLEVGEG